MRFKPCRIFTTDAESRSTVDVIQTIIPLYSLYCKTIFVSFVGRDFILFDLVCWILFNFVIPRFNFHWFDFVVCCVILLSLSLILVTFHPSLHNSWLISFRSIIESLPRTTTPLPITAGQGITSRSCRAVDKRQKKILKLFLLIHNTVFAL